MIIFMITLKKVASTLAHTGEVVVITNKKPVSNYEYIDKKK